MYGVHRTTVYTPDDVKAELERAAAETGRTEADLIREGIRLALAHITPPAPQTGIFASGNPQLSERVDELLADGFGRS
jgi:hypothetical protein